MTKAIATLPFVATTDTGDYVATVNVDTSVDNDWTFNLQNAYDNNSNVIIPKYLIVDNIANNALVTVKIGPYKISLSQYTRKTFQIPNNILTAEIVATVGVVPCYFCQNTPGIPDDTNQLAINQSLVKQTVWTPKAIIATSGQSQADGNAYVEFSAAVPITYSLLQIATLPSGFYMPRLVNVGSANVTIQPFAGDNINTLFTNANPLVLSPGDSVDLFNDTARWQARGELTFTSTNITSPTLAANTHNTVTHNFNSSPDFIWGELTCDIANSGYNVGDILHIEGNLNNNNNAGLQLFDLGDNLTIQWSTSGALGIVPFAGGNTLALAIADWHLNIKARKRL